MADDRQVSLEGRRLFIAIPTYDGRLSVKLAFSLAALMPMAVNHGVSVKLSQISGCSIITLARNILVDQFLKTDCTELLFIDSDICAAPEDILRLVAQGGDKDITAGYYPGRSDDEKLVFYPYLDDNGELEFDGSLMRVHRFGTGFMLIRRHVIETLAQKAQRYVANSALTQVPNVFDFTIREGQFVGEDYAFCDKAGAEGFKVWLDVEISLPHSSTQELTKDFKGEVVQPLQEEISRIRQNRANPDQG